MHHSMHETVLHKGAYTLLILGLLALYLVVLTTPPRTASMQELPFFIDQTVVVEGKVTRMTPIASGTWIVIEQTQSLSVFVPSTDIAVQKDDRIQARGVVKKNGDEK